MRAYVRLEQTQCSPPKLDGITIGMMPLRSNIPDPRSSDWKLTTCPHCGRECWYQTENAGILKAMQPDVKFLCTECALSAGTYRLEKEAKNGT